jgi:hypothetical protein
MVLLHAFWLISFSQQFWFIHIHLLVFQLCLLLVPHMFVFLFLFLWKTLSFLIPKLPFITYLVIGFFSPLVKLCIFLSRTKFEFLINHLQILKDTQHLKVESCLYGYLAKVFSLAYINYTCQKFIGRKKWNYIIIIIYKIRYNIYHIYN